MTNSTEFFENQILSAESIEELCDIVSDLPKDSFLASVSDLSEKYNLSFSKIQIKTGITKSLFYAILNGTRTPQRVQVIKIGLALGATVEEMNVLLKLAKHKELYAKNKEDAVIMFCVKNNKSDIELQELLLEVGSTLNLSE